MESEIPSVVGLKRRENMRRGFRSHSASSGSRPSIAGDSERISPLAQGVYSAIVRRAAVAVKSRCFLGFSAIGRLQGKGVLLAAVFQRFSEGAGADQESVRSNHRGVRRRIFPSRFKENFVGNDPLQAKRLGVGNCKKRIRLAVGVAGMRDLRFGNRRAVAVRIAQLLAVGKSIAVGVQLRQGCRPKSRSAAPLDEGVDSVAKRILWPRAIGTNMAKRATKTVSVRHLADAPRARKPIHREREQKRQERRGKLSDSGKFHFLFIQEKSQRFSFFEDAAKVNGGRFPSFSRKSIVGRSSKIRLFSRFFSRTCLVWEKAKKGCRRRSAFLGVHRHDAWPVRHPTAPSGDHALDRLAGFRMLFQWRIRHFLLHFKTPGFSPFFLRDGFVNISGHWFAIRFLLPSPFSTEGKEFCQ